jgi:hypothetical protein
MANSSNGHAVDDMAVPPNETAVFRIGKVDIKVPALTLWDVEVSGADIRSLDPEMPWSTYAATIVRIIARKLKPDVFDAYAEALQRSCSVEEARNLSIAFNDLLRVSGFPMPAEPAIDLGTGTSTELQPNLPLPSESSTSDTSSEQSL